MKILDDVYLVGSGQIGLSHPFDCHVYLIDGVDEIALVDSGAGLGIKQILANVKSLGIDRKKICKILLTHHHADHSGGCGRLLDRLDAEVYLHRDGIGFVEEGDEESGHKADRAKREIVEIEAAMARLTDDDFEWNMWNYHLGIQQRILKDAQA